LKVACEQEAAGILFTEYECLTAVVCLFFFRVIADRKTGVMLSVLVLLLADPLNFVLLKDVFNTFCR